MRFYQTGAVETLLKIKSSTVRYWEEAGYLCSPPRDEFGRKQYTERHLADLVRFRHFVEILGMTPEQARNALLAESSADQGRKAVLDEARFRLLRCLADSRALAERAERGLSARCR